MATAQPPGESQTPARPTEGMAIAALVVGLVSIPGSFLLYGVSGIFLGSVAIVLGLVARRRIRESGGALAGHGMAKAGWILGICGVALGVVLLVVLIAAMFAFSQYGKGGP